MIDLRRYEKLHTIQMLKHVIRKWWRLELAFADMSSYVNHVEGRVMPPHNDFCRLSLSSREGFRRCDDSIKVTRDKLRAQPPQAGRRCIVHECHLGFDVVACPIMLEQEFAGFLFVSGGVHETLTTFAQQHLLKKVRKVAVDGGAGTDLERALGKIPSLSAAELDQLCDFLEAGVDEIQNYHAAMSRREPEPLAPKEKPGERNCFEKIVGTSRSMQQVFRLLEKIIESDSTVLIQGESGTGKELVARAIHDGGPRATRAFVVQNCSAFNDNLLESALFGHVKGSFTGAIKDKKGLFEIADGGTFFLDEVGDMSPALQVKLLRVLQEGTFTPVGSTETHEVDVRVIAATHKDLQKMVARGEFREDLYYRIHVIKVQIPPLRDRLDDLPLLIDHFIRKHFRPRPGSQQRMQPPRISDGVMAVMQRYPWPGNIRELENEIERCMVLGGDLDELSEDLLSQRLLEVAAEAMPRFAPRDADPMGSLKVAVEQLEREMILSGLIRTHWNKSQLAKELGISRSNLIMKVERYGLDKKTG